MSQPIAIAKPPPIQYPLTRAIVGFVITFKESWKFATDWLYEAMASAEALSVSNLEISAPATKALSPAPVKTIARTSEFDPYLSNKLAALSHISWDIAFMRWGLLNTIQAIFS